MSSEFDSFFGSESSQQEQIQEPQAPEDPFSDLAPSPPQEPLQETVQKQTSKEAKPEPPLTSTEIRPEETAKEVYLIYGLKGDGKTYLALSFKGKILALSFDYKTAMVKRNCFDNDPRITIYDALIKEDFTTPETMLKSSDTTLKYVREVLEKAKQDPPDWILIDGSEILQRIAEDVMRYKNNISAFGGVQWTYWKERRFYIRQIHEMSVRIAKRGVIYTSYVDKDEIVVDGQLKSKTDIPKWLDAIMYEVDEILKVFPRSESDKRKYFAEIQSSKIRPNLTGQVVDITGIQQAQKLTR